MVSCPDLPYIKNMQSWEKWEDPPKDWGGGTWLVSELLEPWYQLQATYKVSAKVRTTGLH